MDLRSLTAPFKFGLPKPISGLLRRHFSSSLRSPVHFSDNPPLCMTRTSQARVPAARAPGFHPAPPVSTSLCDSPVQSVDIPPPASPSVPAFPAFAFQPARFSKTCTRPNQRSQRFLPRFPLFPRERLRLREGLNKRPRKPVASCAAPRPTIRFANSGLVFQSARFARLLLQ
jgi:hypothetical protein